ncbi:MAG: hypothetical protein AAFP97_06920 [Pseudomonadota bacterium]
MKSSILIVLAIGFAGFGALEVAALNPAEAGFGQSDSNASVPLSKTLETSSYEAPDMPEATCLTPALVAAFEPRQEVLNARATELDERQAELEALEKSLQARLTEMDTTRQSLEAMTARLDAAAGEDISHLVDMYATMKAKKAAAIFDRMDPAFAAGFLREIDSARAGLIMAEMGEEQSYRVSLLIANRHAEWRRPQ